MLCLVLLIPTYLLSHLLKGNILIKILPTKAVVAVATPMGNEYHTVAVLQRIAWAANGISPILDAMTAFTSKLPHSITSEAVVAMPSRKYAIHPRNTSKESAGVKENNQANKQERKRVPLDH